MAGLESVGSLHWADWLVLALTLVISIGIGIFYACRERQNTTEQYLMAGRSAQILPAAASLMITYLSSTTLLGDPTENYFFGITFSLYIIASHIAVLITMETFVPLLHPLKITSLQEYLMMRFKSRAVCIVANILQTITLLGSCGTFLFGPPVMLHAMAGFPVWASVVVLGVSATLYSTVGGLTGVIWTDVFQALVIMFTMSTVAIWGTIKAGGIARVWQEYGDSGRLDIKFELNPLNRQDFFTLLLMHTIFRMCFYGAGQSSVQRYCALPSIKRAKLSMFLVIPTMSLVTCFTCYSGVVAYSYYAVKGCDPWRAGYISNINEILPYFIADVFGVPGFSGLYVSCVFCGTLSSLSSYYNSLSAITWQDYLSERKCTNKLGEGRKTFLTKGLVCFYGLISVFLGLGVAQLKGSIIKIAFTVLTPSVSGYFLLIVIGAISRKINWKNALTSCLVGTAAGVWVSMGSQTIPSLHHPLPTITTNCSASHQVSVMSNLTHDHYGNGYTVFPSFAETTYSPDVMPVTLNETNFLDDGSEIKGINNLYRMSYHWMCLWTVAMGMITSFILSFIPWFTTDSAELKLLFPQIRRWHRRKETDYELAKANEALS